jgi:diacylglycerol kinase (ATP)
LFLFYRPPRLHHNFAPVSRSVVIVNPASGRGAGTRLLPRLNALFAEHGITDIRTTAAPGDEARVVGEAVRDGAETIAVAGGDGTWGKCAVALARLGSPARMAFIANGTGNDFAKNLPTPAADHRAMAALVAHGTREQTVDLGRVDEQWFLNVAGFGFDVEVNVATADRTGWLRGDAVYIAAALRLLFRYHGFRVTADVFGDEGPRLRMMLIISNGKNFGGAFLIAPSASVDDGLLDFVSVGDVHKLARIPLFARALRGAHLTHPAVGAVRAAAATLTFDAPPRFELDGDLHQATGSIVQVGLIPRALRVLVG